MQEGDSILEIVARAGGATPAGALRQVKIVEPDGTSQQVDVFTPLRLGGPKPKLQLHDGEVVIVPENKARVLVTGAVNHPSYQTIPETGVLTVEEAILQAGGPHDSGQTAGSRDFLANSGRRAATYHIDRPDGKWKIPGPAQPLHGGDVVYVPEGKQSRSFWDSISRAVSAVGVLSVFGL